MSPSHLPHSPDDAGAASQLDERLAADVKNRLAWDAWVPKDAVQVHVKDGWVTLQGELAHERDKTAAMEDVSRLFGINGVKDRTTVKSP